MPQTPQTPQTPKCGFTEQVLAILRQHSAEFTYYDVIADEQMRYWLRDFSGWPPTLRFTSAAGCSADSTC